MQKTILNLKKRNAAETRFKVLGMASIAFALLFLMLLFFMIFSRGTSAFWQNQIALEVNLEQHQQGEELDYRMLVKNALRQKFSQVQEISEVNSLYQIISKISNLELKEQIERNPQLLANEYSSRCNESNALIRENRSAAYNDIREQQKRSESDADDRCSRDVVFWFSASSKADMYFKHNNTSGLNEHQLSWLNQLKEENAVRQVFNWKFFHFADSREAEIAGISAGLMGSFLVMIIFLIFAFPIGVMCAFYLEEFAPKNSITDIIEISINNLAAIPSIIYGLLGLTIYLQIMNLPRSSSLVGGMTLFMLVLPVVIIATRNTIRSIPNTIRDGAAALGASKMQVTLHHLLPLSVPGIMTGTILAISRALGETAPLLMIGMVAFIADVPASFTDPTSVLPVQIYLWSDSPEAGFAEKCSAAIIVLLGFLIVLNLVAVIIRKKFERKW